MSKSADHEPQAWIAQGRKERQEKAAKAGKPVRKAAAAKQKPKGKTK